MTKSGPDRGAEPVPVGQALEDLGGVLQGFQELVAGVTARQWGSPTPCAEWNVRQLVDHVVAGNVHFAQALAEVGSTPPAPTPLPGAAEPVLEHRASADALSRAFAQPGALDRLVAVPLGVVPGLVALHLRLTELLVHGWDLAKATAQPVGFSEHLAAQELAFTVQTLASVPPDRSPFAPPLPVAETAPALDRLAACLGRDVR